MASNLRIYIEDNNGTRINNIEAQDAIDYAVNLRISSRWPKGYDSCSFRIRRRDILATFAVRENYTVLVQDGLKIVWQGFIVKLNIIIRGTDEYVYVTAAGTYQRLLQQRIQKRWIDTSAPLHLEFVSQDTELEFQVNKTRNLWRLIGTTGLDLTYTNGSKRVDKYSVLGESNYIRRIIYSYRHRNGQDYHLVLYNVDQAVNEDDNIIQSVTIATPAPRDVTFVGGNTQTFQWWTRVENNEYDQNDWYEMYDMIVYAEYESSHPDYASPNYTIDEIVIDMLKIANRETAYISSDYGDIATIATAPNAFTIEQPITIAQAIERALAYSNSSYETLGLAVWDRFGTSDGLPKAVVTAWNISDYEYIVDLNDEQLRAFQNSLDTNRIFNYVRVSYVNPDGVEVWLNPEDNAGLKDQDSIDAYGKREGAPIKVGKNSSATEPIYAGGRFVEHNKAGIYTGSISVIGSVHTKAGGSIPAAWVRAGERVYIPQLGITFVMRAVSYDAEREVLTITPDAPPDTPALERAELKRRVEAYESAAERVG